VALAIRVLDEQAIADAYGFDGSFLVESELALFAEDGLIRHEVVSVHPYRKCYGRDAGDDLSARLKDPDKAAFLADLDGSVVGRVLRRRAGTAMRGSMTLRWTHDAGGRASDVP